MVTSREEEEEEETEREMSCRKVSAAASQCEDHIVRKACATENSGKRNKCNRNKSHELLKRLGEERAPPSSTSTVHRRGMGSMAIYTRIVSRAHSLPATQQPS